MYRKSGNKYSWQFDKHWAKICGFVCRGYWLDQSALEFTVSNETGITEAIFQAALQIASIESRREYLANACGDNQGLFEQVQRMLDSHDCESTVDPSTPRQSEPNMNSNWQSTGDPAQNQTQPPARASNDNPEVHSKHRMGDYELIEEIARGGMGRVYRARQISLNRIVAVKTILTGQFASEDEIQRFYREAEAAANLDHPGIVSVIEVGEHQGQHFFSMAFVEGSSLAVESKKGAISPRVAATYIKKTAAAVHYAHQHGIIHRDLKPGNILLDENGEPRIVDFGLAKKVELDSELTKSGIVMGTPSFMPPEQASGSCHEITKSSDIYSLGAILYSLLTGRPPFGGANSTETLIQVIQSQPVEPRRLESGIPRDLELICLKCLEKNRVDRYPTALALADDLQRFLAGEPILAKNDIWRRIRKWTLREPVLAAHLAAIAMLAVILLINFLVFGLTAESFRTLIINEAIFLAWAAVAIGLQKIQNAIAAKSLIPTIWATINPLFLTATLCANVAPRGELLASYLLLVVMTGFFRSVKLVAITTLSSLVGFVALIVYSTKLSADSDPSFSTPSYQVVFCLTLVVTGILLGFQVNRLNRICGTGAT